MAEQNRQHERDYRNGRTFEGRGSEPWQSRDDDDRDDRARSSGDRDRWSFSNRNQSYGRGGSEWQTAGDQDRGDYSSSGRHGQGQGYESWRDDDTRDYGAGSSRERGYGQDQYRSQRFGGQGYRGGEQFGGGSRGYRGGEQFGGGSQGYRGGEQFGGGSQGYRGGEWSGSGSQGYRGGEHSGGGSQGYPHGQGQGGSRVEERFGRGIENFGRTGDYSSGMGRQSHAGKGPKNYQRSDERIQEQVSDRLTDDDSLDAGEIIVQVKGGEVTLSGTVNSREDKRRAEDLVESCSGVKEVINNLRINRADESAGNRERSGQQSGSGSQSSTGQGATGSTSSKGGRQPNTERE
jgi:hypothetical protein